MAANVSASLAHWATPRPPSPGPSLYWGPCDSFKDPTLLGAAPPISLCLSFRCVLSRVFWSTHPQAARLYGCSHRSALFLRCASPSTRYPSGPLEFRNLWNLGARKTAREPASRWEVWGGDSAQVELSSRLAVTPALGGVYSQAEMLPLEPPGRIPGEGAFPYRRPPVLSFG